VIPTFGQALGPTPAIPGVAPPALDVNGNGIFNDDLVVIGQTVTNTAAVNSTGGLNSFLEGTGPDTSYDESENVKIKVRGYRRFF
jgi:hypothetical protein